MQLLVPRRRVIGRIPPLLRTPAADVTLNIVARAAMRKEMAWHNQVFWGVYSSSHCMILVRTQI